MDDPIVKEVRETREKLLAAHGYDMQKYIEYLREQEKQNPHRLINGKDLKRQTGEAPAAADSK